MHEYFKYKKTLHVAISDNLFKNLSKHDKYESTMIRVESFLLWKQLSSWRLWEERWDARYMHEDKINRYKM